MTTKINNLQIDVKHQTLQEVPGLVEARTITKESQMEAIKRDLQVKSEITWIY